MILRSGFGELVKYVEIPLIHNLSYYSRFLEQVVGDIGSDRLALLIELQFQILAES